MQEDPILNNKQNITTHEYINTHGHYIRKKMYVMQPITYVDSNPLSYDMIDKIWLTIRCEEGKKASSSKKAIIEQHGKL